MSQKWQRLDGDEVINLEDEKDKSLMPHSTFTASEFLDKIQLTYRNKQLEKWFFEGVDCKLLRPNSGWKKGKVRVFIAFSSDSDEPDTTLNELTTNKP